MRFLIQICQNATVSIDNSYEEKIDKGEVVFVGFTQNDTTLVIDKMIDRLLKLRIFKDEMGKTNLSIDNFNGEILFISQFTLYADLSKGNRPSFVNALSSDKSIELYNYTCKKLLSKYSNVKFGKFGADMKVSLINDGPFTIMLDSERDL